MNRYSRMMGAALGLVVGAGALPATAQMHQPGARHSDSVALGTAQVTEPIEFRGGHPVVAVILDGKGPYRFILDTGAHGSVIDAAVAAELKLESLGDTELNSPLGEKGIPSRMVRIGRLDMGDAHVTGARAATMDLAGLFRSKDVAGILSPNALQGCLVKLDYPSSTVTVTKGSLPPADGSRIFEFPADADLPEITLSVAGKEIRSHVDSGSSGGISLPSSWADKLPLEAPPVEIHRARTVDKEFVILGATLKGDVKLGGYTLRNPRVSFSELPMGNVGFEFLKNFSVTLDVSQHRLLFDRGEEAATWTPSAPPATALASSAVPSPAPRRYGIRIGSSPGGELEVVGTDSGSVAEKAGLLPGDRILKVNGTPAKEIDASRLGEMLHVSPVKLAIQRDGKETEITMALD